MKTLKKISLNVVMVIAFFGLGYLYQYSWGLWNLPGAVVSGVITVAEEATSPLTKNGCYQCLSESFSPSCLIPCLENVLRPKSIPYNFTYIRCEN